jgi:methylenetetrahydrofolate reductase (NADPH)
MLQYGIFANYSVEEVSIADYPEGHPAVTDEALARELKDKIDLFAADNLDAVTMPNVSAWHRQEI